MESTKSSSQELQRLPPIRHLTHQIRHQTRQIRHLTHQIRRLTLPRGPLVSIRDLAPDVLPSPLLLLPHLLVGALPHHLKIEHPQYPLQRALLGPLEGSLEPREGVNEAKGGTATSCLLLIAPKPNSNPNL